MKSAYVVINEARVEVQASEVSHADYKKIFECPECHAVLTFRQGHYRGYSWVGPSFVHGADAPQACSRRVDFGIVVNDAGEINFTAKGQSAKKLGKALMTCLTYHRTGHISSIDSEFPYLSFGGFQDIYIKRQITYNKGLVDINDKRGLRYSIHPKAETQIYPDIDLLIAAADEVLNSPQSQRFFTEQIKEFRKEVSANQAVCTFLQAKYSDVAVEDSIERHCDQLQGISMFLSQGCPKKTRQDFLDWILFADPRLPISLSFFKDYSHEKDTGKIRRIFTEVNNQRQDRLDLFSQFKVEALHLIVREPSILQPSPQDSQQTMGLYLHNFMHFILTTTFEAIEFIDWSWLPYFYE